MVCLDPKRATDTIAISYISTYPRLLHHKRTNMTAIAKEVVGERTVGLAVKVLNLNDHVPQGTLCEVRRSGQ